MATQSKVISHKWVHSGKQLPWKCSCGYIPENGGQAAQHALQYFGIALNHRKER